MHGEFNDKPEGVCVEGAATVAFRLVVKRIQLEHKHLLAKTR